MIGYIGDVHGSLSNVEYAVRFCVKMGATTLIQTGDFWCYDDHRTITKLNRVLTRIGEQHGGGNTPTLYFIDGNHENYNIIDPDGDIVTYGDHVTYIPRGSVIDIEGISHGFLGGASSSDREYRQEGKNWWPQEAIHNAQAEKLYDKQFDVFVTHDTSAAVFSDLMILNGHSLEKSSDGANDREFISAVVDAVHPKVHFHGHHHYFKITDVDDVKTVSLGSDSAYGCAVVVEDTGMMHIAPSKYTFKDIDPAITEALIF